MNYLEHEAILARLERKSKRLWILAIVLNVLCVISNYLWILHFIK